VKNIIKHSFSRFINHYEREAVVQRKASKIILKLSKDLKGTGVDLGCGTGFLFTADKKLVGIDISFEMVKKYKEKNSFAVVGDIENLPFKKSCFDFAVSNFSLHWTDFEKSIFEIKNVLKPNSYFVFNIPIKGSLNIISEILKKENFGFLTEKEILNILKSQGFKIELYFVKEYTLGFKFPEEFLKHLHKTGSMVGKEGKSLGEKKKIIKKFQNYKKPVFLNYKLLFIKAKKV
jgi:malonyl-CoA O-methyltransferase